MKNTQIGEFDVILATLILLEREFFTDKLLDRIRFIIVMIRWIGLAPWKFEILVRTLNGILNRTSGF